MTTYLFFRELYDNHRDGYIQSAMTRNRRFMLDLYHSTPFQRYTGRQMDIYEQL